MFRCRFFRIHNIDAKILAENTIFCQSDWFTIVSHTKNRTDTYKSLPNDKSSFIFIQVERYACVNVHFLSVSMRCFSARQPYPVFVLRFTLHLFLLFFFIFFFSVFFSLRSLISHFMFNHHLWPTLNVGSAVQLLFNTRILNATSIS